MVSKTIGLNLILKIAGFKLLKGSNEYRQPDNRANLGEGVDYGYPGGLTIEIGPTDKYED